MSKHTPENLHTEIEDGTFCLDCGSDSDTLLRDDLEEKVKRWQQCVDAMLGIPDPAAFVKAARAMSFVVSCQSDDCTDESPCEACKRHSAFRAADKPA